MNASTSCYILFNINDICKKTVQEINVIFYLMYSSVQTLQYSSKNEATFQ